MKIIHSISYLKRGKIILLLLIIISQKNWSQQFTTNRNPVGMEHNLLFNATTRYLVTTTGPALDLGTLFDGRMGPTYTSVAPTDVAPTVILIENLPGYHTQAGAWVGWSTRYWPANRFKIEGFDTYQGANIWRTISDYSATDYSGADFNVAIPYGGEYTKLKFTFYKATGTNGYLGVSELFFIHTEATSPYQGLLASSINNWDNNSSNLCYTSNGKVGIGTNSPDEKLTVKGKIHTQEIKVDMLGSLVPDYVFTKDYKLKTLPEVETYINENSHLPEIPSANEIEKNGLLLAEMSMSLLKKVEELTLYAIEQEKKTEKLTLYIMEQNKRIETLEKKK
jgi:hypothetical protein